MRKRSETLTRLITQVYELKKRYEAIEPMASRQQLNSPARAEDIARVEEMYGVRLPADYREFLLSHNGWEKLNGDHNLLSTEDMLAGPLHEWVKQVQESSRKAGDLGAAEGLVIEAAPSSPSIVYLDARKARRGKLMDVVESGLDDDVRYKSFTSYLRSIADALQEMLEDADVR